MQVQTFFIPKKISGLRLSKLPLSAHLCSALKKLNVETFGDLSGMAIRDFQRVSNRGAVLFAEMNGLTQRARNGDFAKMFGQSGSLLNLGSAQKPRVIMSGESAAEKDGKYSTTQSCALPPQASTDERIFIPQEARGTPISTFEISVRLWHVLEYKQFRILGDIHGILYDEFRQFRNCGKKTVTELRELVRQIQRAHPASRADGKAGEFQEPFRVLAGDCLNVPVNVRDLKFRDLPVSVRLENVLEKRKAIQLGDLNGASVTELKGIGNCGKKTIVEIISLIERAAAGEFNAATDTNVEWSPVNFVTLLDSLISELSARDAEILEMRLSGEKERLLTLEDIGARFKLTRERVRQIVKKITGKLRKAGSRRLDAYLLQIKKICRETVCPLTPELFVRWLGDKISQLRFSPGFYVRLLCELNPSISAWHGSQETPVKKKIADAIETTLQSLLRVNFQTLALPEAFLQTKAKLGGGLDVGEFFDVLRHSRQFRVEFQQPDCPTVRMARFFAADLAQTILQSSDSALTPEEILARAQTNFGQDVSKWNPRTLGNVLTEEKGFYLIGPRTYGLRRHFTLPETSWAKIISDFGELLKHEAHPISTSDVINNQRFDWTSLVNAYELACILRADDRFIDLGKFLFALAEWGIQEREYVKDLVPKILEKAGRPLTGDEILTQLQQLRSVSPYAISGHLRKHPQVHDYGFGHYGLKSWGESVHGNIVTDSALIERVIRRAEPPLRFARLCEILDFAPEGKLVDKLWQTCAALTSIFRLPDECSGVTRLIHKKCRLERALIATARQVNRPLPLYEFQWELNEQFGSLFEAKSLDDLRRCLEQSPMFLRNANDEFILDIHLEQLGLDAVAIRAACVELLSETNEIVGCEDLLERLEADGKSWENLSADILASLLRDAEAFQEVGHDRFRLKTCKH